MNVYIIASRELKFTKRCLCIYFFHYMLCDGAHGTCMHIALAELLGKRFSLLGLTGRALTWTVRGVGSIPTWGKNQSALKWMHNNNNNNLFIKRLLYNRLRLSKSAVTKFMLYKT